MVSANHSLLPANDSLALANNRTPHIRQPLLRLLSLRKQI
ncbi:hypothetical protein GCWU000325_01706 [Alloprevotella tannerae ATCC 51259]|uniref:Uncharacterized protein n=1 Tax=Alloprevotella tannerae ATCC 51259 TaxID=626522 RepID=C9LHP0_9BACT|nr:hypothetical protein GCWU000325_01706 [Alloprevotella tannerae ATCC 51259]